MFLTKGSLNNNTRYIAILTRSSDHEEMDFQPNMVQSRIKEIEQRIQKSSSNVVDEESIL